MKKSIPGTWCAFMLSALFLWTAETPQPDIEQIIRSIDDLYRSDSSYSEVQMHIKTPHWERTLKMNVWTQGMDKTFIRITYPPKEKGVATLRIGNEMWNFLPKTNKVMKIPPSMMMSSWMGSDFTNDDLVKEFTFLDDYSFELITPENSEENLLYILFTPKEGRPIVWGKVIAAVRGLDFIPVEEKFYDEKGQLMRVMHFKNIQELGGRTIPSVLELIPLNKEGHATVIEYKAIEFNRKIPEETFSLRNLRSQ